MTGTVPVTNTTPVVQVVGPAWIPPGATADVPAEYARSLPPDLAVGWDRVPDLFAPSLERGALRGLALVTALSAFDGYGQFGAHVVPELLRRGVAVDLYRAGRFTPEGLDPALLDHLGAPKARWATCLARGNPDDTHDTALARRVVMSTMWEGTPIPPAWVPILNRDPLVLVSSPAQIPVFRESGVTAPIDVLPEPVDLALWRERRTHPDPDGPYTIVSWSRMSSRKMPVEMLLAFGRAFPRDKYPDVRLELKTIAGNFGGMVGQIPRIDDPRIAIHNAAWPGAALRDWAGKAHCAFFLSHGEGFFLPPVQAMALGVPTVVVDHSGPSAYADERWNWPVRLDPRTPTVPAPFGQDFRWWEPDLDHAVHQLRACYERRDEAEARARRARRMVGRYAIDKVVDALVAHLAGIS